MISRTQRQAQTRVTSAERRESRLWSIAQGPSSADVQGLEVLSVQHFMWCQHLARVPSTISAHDTWTLPPSVDTSITRSVLDAPRGDQTLLLNFTSVFSDKYTDQRLDGPRRETDGKHSLLVNSFVV